MAGTGRVIVGGGIAAFYDRYRPLAATP